MGNEQSTASNIPASINSNAINIEKSGIVNPIDDKNEKVCPVSKTVVKSGFRCPFAYIFPSSECKPTPESVGNTNTTPVTPVNSESNGCPMQLKSNENAGSDNQNTKSECPHLNGQGNKKSNFYVNKDQYNVYSQKIDPRNNMPSNANQCPAAGQDIALSTDRVKSTIPKGGTESDTWTYPSPQMFWNAIVRKNKMENSEEIKEMETVVAIHNNMNEKTWQQILEWEKFHVNLNDEKEGKNPKLLHFIGRPDELSPKAYFRTLLGQPQPFDRHDWTVDRGGNKVRYVIDYYFDEEIVNNDNVPKDKSDHKAIKSIRVDARPAIDDISVLIDRVIRMPFSRLLGKSIYSPPPMFPIFSNMLKSNKSPPVQSMKHEDDRISQISLKWNEIQEKCSTIKIDMNKCIGKADEEECLRVKSVELQKCTASVVCPEIAKKFDDAVHQHLKLENKDDTMLVEISYLKLTECLDNFREESEKILKENK